MGIYNAKPWMKTNEVGKTVCIFQAFNMEKFFDKEGLIDILHTMYTKGKISEKDYTGCLTILDFLVSIAPRIKMLNIFVEHIQF